MSDVKRRKLRKCSVCDATDHRADFHGSPRDPAVTRTLDPIDVVMRSMLDPAYALWLVTEDVVGQALANATRAFTAARMNGIGIGAGDSMLRALAELEIRARDIPPELVSHARELRRKADEAQVAYQVTASKITEQLGYPKRS